METIKKKNSITYNTIPITGEDWKNVIYNIILLDTAKNNKNKIIERNGLILLKKQNKKIFCWTYCQFFIKFISTECMAY